MSAHAFDSIAARQDELLDDEAERSLRIHLLACAECRAFARDVDRVDRLLRRPEPHLAVPPLVRPRLSSAVVGWIGALSTTAVVFVVITVVVGAVLRDRSVESGRAGEATRDIGPIGVTLAGASIGASPEEIRNTLGDPEFVTDASRMWTYSNGIVVFFEGPAGDPRVAQRIFAPHSAAEVTPGLAVQTAEGFSVLGNTGDFRRAYAAHTIVASASNAFQPVLSASGRGSDGLDVSVVAVFDVFGQTGSGSSLSIFRGRTFDTFPDPCPIIARAVDRAGLGHANLSVGPSGVFPHGLEAWGALGCGAIYDGGWNNAHVLIRLEPSSSQDHFLLERIFTREIVSWTRDGPDIWLGHGEEEARPLNVTWSAVAVFAEPYFFVVTERNDDTARRLAQAVLVELRTAR